MAPSDARILAAIRSTDDDAYSIAAALDVPVDVVQDRLAELVNQSLIYRWDDNGVLRYGLRRERRAA